MDFSFPFYEEFTGPIYKRPPPLSKVRPIYRCFFFLRVYFSKAGFIRHLGNAPGDNMQKTPLQNSSPFSHSFKMFECMSTQESHEIRNVWQFSPDMVGWLFQVIWYFDMKSFLKHYLEHCRIKKYPRIQYHALLAKRDASLEKNNKRHLQLSRVGYFCWIASKQPTIGSDVFLSVPRL